jgi:hypothetical protein
LLPTLIQGDAVPVGSRGMASTEPYVHLSPVEVVEAIGGSVFWSPPLEIAWWAAVWLLGLGGLALAIVALRHRRRSPVAWGTLAAAALAVVVGWTQLVPAPVFAGASPSRAIAYEPVCTQRSIPICLHPAYESVLDETADLVDPIVRPLAGLPGFPIRAEQLRPPQDDMPADPADIWTGGTTNSDTLPISPPCTQSTPRSAATAIALAAVQLPTDVLLEIPPAQAAIAVWLLRQAGWEVTTEFEIGACFPDGGVANFGLRIEDGVIPAADRFGALPPEEQHAWLEANFAALRAGELTLEDLP